jgi:site-specific DNA-methyltransferase (adenine-specific)
MILTGDCFEVIKTLENNSVDLVITSPPYADIVNYGKNISIKKPKDYCDWILPLFNEIHRVLKPSGSFILNINDNCSNGLRNPFIYELIYRSQKETNLKFYDTYIWHKKNGIPNGSKKRFRNNTEFIFHFVKNQKELKFYMDRVLEDTKESSSKRYETPKFDNQGQIVDGVRERKKVVWVRRTSMKVDETGSKDPDLVQRIVPDKVRPDNVFRFQTAGAARDNTIRHPAPFNKELPTYFIKLLTDEGDTVLDVFSGIGTTGLGCNELNRQYIGIELNEKYAEFSKKRLNGEQLEEWVVCQYDMDDNLIACYKNRDEASKATGVESGDIMRTYNRTKFESRGGFKWKLEKNETIHQYDMEGNYIASFKGITSAAKSIGYSTPHNIMMCYRGFRNEAGGFQWKLEPKTEYVINQYDLEDNFIRSWKTITEIENTLGFDSHNHIEDCIRKGNKTSYGFQWKLEEKETINWNPDDYYPGDETPTNERL